MSDLDLELVEQKRIVVEMGNRIAILKDIVQNLIEHPRGHDCGEPYRSRLKALAMNVEWYLTVSPRTAEDSANLCHHAEVMLAFAKLEPVS